MWQIPFIFLGLVLWSTVPDPVAYRPRGLFYFFLGILNGRMVRLNVCESQLSS